MMVAASGALLFGLLFLCLAALGGFILLRNNSSPTTVALASTAQNNTNVLAEIVASGIRVFSTERPETIVKFLAEPAEVRERYLDVNVHRAAISFAIADLPAAIDDAFATHGWLTW